VYSLGRLIVDERPWLAPLIYATFALPASASNLVTTDSLLTLWETAAVCAFAHAAWNTDPTHRCRYLLSMWIAFALAFLTKGPPGLLPLLAILVYQRSKLTHEPALSLRAGTGLLIVIGVNLLWFGPALVQEPQLLKYFVLEETVARIFTDHHHRNAEWYGALIVYVPVLLLGTLPWTIHLVRSIIRSTPAFVRSGRVANDRPDPRDSFLLLWLGIPLLVFVLARSRLPLYLLPLCVPMALLTARELNSRSFEWTRKHVALISIWAMLILASRVISTELPTKKNSALLADAIQSADPTPFDEVVFFSNPVLLGLNFYLDKEVESVYTQALEDELREDERRLWLVSPAKSMAFLGALSRLKTHVRPLGKVDDRYLLFQELPG
jgi:4-amino-4-deoxy-L-arabinose transferase